MSYLAIWSLLGRTNVLQKRACLIGVRPCLKIAHLVEVAVGCVVRRALWACILGVSIAMAMLNDEFAAMESAVCTFHQLIFVFSILEPLMDDLDETIMTNGVDMVL
jgi:hypothetical protein